MTPRSENEILGSFFLSSFLHFLFEVGVNANLREILRGLKEG